MQAITVYQYHLNTERTEPRTEITCHEETQNGVGNTVKPFGKGSALGGMACRCSLGQRRLIKWAPETLHPLYSSPRPGPFGNSLCSRVGGNVDLFLKSRSVFGLGSGSPYNQVGCRRLWSPKLTGEEGRPVWTQRTQRRHPVLSSGPGHKDIAIRPGQWGCGERWWFHSLYYPEQVT